MLSLSVKRDFMDKKNYLQELKELNNRRNYCKEISNIIHRITVSDFLSIEETREKLNAIIERIENSEFQKNPLSCDVNALFEQYIHKIYRDDKFIFFQYNSVMIGALTLYGFEIVENSGYIFEQSPVAKGWNDLFIVTKDMQSGFCIWKGEYDIRIYQWNKS